MSYQAFPLEVFNASPPAIRKAHTILQTAIKHATSLTDFHIGCEAACGRCETCESCKRTIARKLLAPDSQSWEVWRIGEAGELVDFVGILRVSIEAGDATIHYYFFDGKLRDKTDLLLGWTDWLFSQGFHRLTTEIPADAFALARHATQSLGFGGPFRFERNGAAFPVEGVKQEAIQRDGRMQDLLILGRLNGKEERS